MDVNSSAILEIQSLAKIIGAVVSLAVTVISAWVSKKWAPPDQNLPGGAEGAAVVLTAVPIIMLWTFLDSAQDLNTVWKCAVIFTTGTLISLLAYSSLRGVLIFRYSQRRGPHVEIVGGFTVIKGAAANRKAIKDMLVSGADPDEIWTSASRTMAKNALALGYISLICMGSLALTSAAIMVTIVRSAKSAQTADVDLNWQMDGECRGTRTVVESKTQAFVQESGGGISCEENKLISIEWPVPAGTKVTNAQAFWIAKSAASVSEPVVRISENKVIATASALGPRSETLPIFQSRICAAPGVAVLRLTGTYVAEASSVAAVVYPVKMLIDENLEIRLPHEDNVRMESCLFVFRDEKSQEMDRVTLRFHDGKVPFGEVFSDKKRFYLKTAKEIVKVFRSESK